MKNLFAMALCLISFPLFATTFTVSGNRIHIIDGHISSYGRGLAVKDSTHQRIIGHRCLVVYNRNQCSDVYGGTIYYHLRSSRPEMSDQINSYRWTQAYDIAGTFKKIDVGDPANSYFEIEVDEFSRHR